MDLSDENIKQILQGISIPPQPQILVDLQMEQFQPDPNIIQIAKLISQDVGLSGTVLKTVNSAFYSLPRKVTSIEQAVTLVGYNSIINIVNGISIKGELEDSTIIELNRFWDTAQDIALICAHVAHQIEYSNPDTAYALGLFHNAGIPLMRQRYPDYFETMRESYAQTNSRIIDLENDRYKTNHAVIGYYVAKSWNLPKIVCLAIAEHHNLATLLQEGNRTEVLSLLSILKIAEHLAGNYFRLGDQNTDFEWQNISEELLTFVGLGQYDLNLMLETFQDLGLDIPSRI